MGALTPLIISFTKPAGETAARIAVALNAEHQACGSSAADAKTVLATAFTAGRPIIGVCATGILIRHLAPLLGDKHIEPPAISVSADGQHVVPLLGGHHGANSMATEIAELFKGKAAITTGSHTRFSRALDEPPAGYFLSHPAAAKPAMAALIGGAEIKLEGHAPWLAEAGYPLSKTGSVSVTVTERTDAKGLVYHPQTLIAGVGCERHAEPQEVIDLIEKTLADNGLSPKSLAAIASIDLKADEQALAAAVNHFGVPLRLFPAKDLAAEADRLPNPSEIVRTETGTPGVSEAAAIKAGELIVEKQKSRRATCAIGRASAPIDVSTFGRARGAVHIVGIGPGEATQRTASTVNALRQVQDWVGYGLYLDLIADLKSNQTEHRFGLGDEEPRVRHALELAATGKKVALVCSGDAQIYAMGALVFELLNAEGARALSDNARRVAIETHPGISAFQMASARGGALIGHDFCCISLSDLLTPRDDIIRRIAAAANGDFVTAFYNPRSLRRTDLLDHAKDVFAAHRPADTPVIIARSLGRPDETVRIVRLADFDPAEVDMMTIVMIGASQSTSFTRGDGKTATFTPRGYERKSNDSEAAE